MELLTVSQLRELGQQADTIVTQWAGARDLVSRGIKVWAKRQIKSQRSAVSTSLAACELVVGRYVSEQKGLPPKSYIDSMLAMIRRWLDDPSRECTERVRAALDITRSAHAWQREEDVAPFWILDAVDHASLAVWSGETASYIVPTDYTTTAARSITCVYHALVDLKEPAEEACKAVMTAVLNAAAATTNPATTP